MSAIQSFAHTRWDSSKGDVALQRAATSALENGKVLFFPKLPFELAEDEASLLSPSVSDGRAKNISLNPPSRIGLNLRGRIQHTSAEGAEREALIGMMDRFAQSTTTLVNTLFPRYSPKLERARTSYRPVEIEGREYSPTKDDTRLHVDAFPTRPMRGSRILRVFSNINPAGAPRVWHVGEPFPDMARRVLPKVKEPSAFQPWLLAAVGATRGLRSRYDNLMLGLHDEAKLDDDYQASARDIEFAFPPGSTWLCFTDEVMHAALTGQYVLEQTFHLKVKVMVEPQRAPIRVLEEMMGKRLAW